eukprot:SAG31_NODE_249_length_19118_cov_47.456195_14_plen_180_part_00
MVFVPMQYVVLAGCYLWSAEQIRERVLPAIAVGSLAGETSRVRGEYRSALLRLQQNAESVVAIKGTEFERCQILGCYRRLETKLAATFAQTRKDALTKQTMAAIEPMFQSLLVELPFVLATAAAAAAVQSSQEGMAANASAIAQMTFTKTLVVRMMSLSGGLLKMPRLMLVRTLSNTTI